jgi:putative transposase
VLVPRSFERSHAFAHLGDHCERWGKDFYASVLERSGDAEANNRCGIMRGMSRWHNIYEDNHAHFCTYTVKNWAPLLTESAIACLYEEWRTNSERFSVKIIAYVIMPEHVHMLIWSELGDNITRFLQRVLGQTSKRLKPGVGGFWKEHPRVFPVFLDEALREKADYIHANPVRRGLVETPEMWAHSSYRQIAFDDPAPMFRCASIE